MGLRLAVACACAIWVAAALADEYPAGRIPRFARYVKDTRQTDLDFIKGQSVPGAYVKRHRHAHGTDFSLWRGRWHVLLHLAHPPDELTSGTRYVIPLEVNIVQEGDDPIAYQVTAKAHGIARGRVGAKPARVTMKRRGDKPQVEAGELAFTPRLDWDAEEIGVEVALTDGAGTEWIVARWAWWTNQLPERHHTPRRRELDPPEP